MIRFFLLLVLTASFFISSAQDEPAISLKTTDTSSLLQAFKRGKTEGHFRLYYMSTNNDDPLTDYYALAFGGGLKYRTRSYKGFQLGVGGFFIWNLASSDLTRPDSVTGVFNRYEIGQFDQANPSNKKDLQRLEDFYIQYNFKKSFFRYGKQVIKTPFINPQDGRMRPTGEQGFWIEMNEIKKVKFEGGWLTQISPRGTLRWYRGASSIGIYPSGISVLGVKSNYYHNLDSKGIAVAGIHYQLGKKVKIQAWEHWIDNISNTLLVQADGEFPLSENRKFTGGIQFIHQQAVHQGGNDDPSKTYFDPSQHAVIMGASAGLINGHTTTRLNYTRITKSGRFLFPREWGREPLYTFMPRERNEGAGDVHAVTLNIIHQFVKQRLLSELSIGRYTLPDVKEYRLNKYGFPSYSQVNLDLRYNFGGYLQGLQMHLLYLYKKRIGNHYNDWKYSINKVNMHQVNLIINYRF